MLNHGSRVILSDRSFPASANVPVSSEPTDILPALTETLPDLKMDWEHLHQISDGSEEFELELLQIFLEDCWRHLTALRKAIADHDLKCIEREAHHLKGASANIGARAMQVAADALEQEARQQKMVTADRRLIELERSLKQLEAFITSKL